MDRREAAGTLREIARLLEIAGDNPHRVRAFDGAARAVDTAVGDLDELVASGRVLELRGVGKGTAAVLEELAEGRRPQALLDAQRAVPRGVREMLKLPGLGPKKVRTLWRELGVESIGELEYACRENRLLDLRGFGPASQASILDAVVFHRQAGERRLLHEAWAAAELARETLAAAPAVDSVTVAGELRRGDETVGEIAFVIGLVDPDAAEAVTRTVGGGTRVEAGQWLCRPDGGLPLRLWFTRTPAVAVTLVRATGSADFVAALEARAPGGGLGDPAAFDGADEAAVFKGLDLAWVPPELRQDKHWLARAERGGLPDLVEIDDLLGVLHNHTTDSDGSASLEDMAAGALGRGWRYFGVADHSPAAFYANGVDAARLRDQWARADAWNDARPGLRIVKGLEADILTGGGLDIPEGCERGLDYVVGSVHSSFRLTEEAQTDRIVTAVRHPACRVLGHPTGRLLLARPGYAVDLDRVLDACAEHGVAVEINASPYRLDLDWRWARRAIDRGLKLVISPDAHAVEGLDDLRWGVTVARRAGASAGDLVNCADIDDFLRR